MASRGAGIGGAGERAGEVESVEGVRFDVERVGGVGFEGGLDGFEFVETGLASAVEVFAVFLAVHVAVAVGVTYGGEPGRVVRGEVQRVECIEAELRLREDVRDVEGVRIAQGGEACHDAQGGPPRRGCFPRRRRLYTRVSMASRFWFQAENHAGVAYDTVIGGGGRGRGLRGRVSSR